MTSTLVFCSFSFAWSQQEVKPNEISTVLTYSPSVSAPSTYKVVKNLHNVDISEEVNKQMNLYRRFDQSVEWEVNSDLTILLYPFNYASEFIIKK